MPSASLTDLPIHAVLPALKKALRQQTRMVLQAAPGAGKSSVVPIALLDADWLRGRQIWMLEPRRLAAQAAARQLAKNMGEPAVGESVGLLTRDQQKISAQTRIVVLTEGILTQRLQQDPELNGVAAVIFDEFHERSLHADLGLALCRDVQSGLREDLRLLLMSATLDGEPLAREWEADWLVCPGRQYPLELNHRPMAPEETWGAGLRRLIEEIAKADGGSVLVFLPGEFEIRKAHSALQSGPLPVYPLYARLPAAEQDAALFSTQRRVILATAVAETSLTVAGVDTVIDSGWARWAEFDPVAGHTQLVTRRVTEAQAGQRAGRAGRTGPGKAWRLWSAEESLRPELAPEIHRADLGALALELVRWGSLDLPWLDAPPSAHLEQAMQRLQSLALLDERGQLTPRGQAVTQMPTDHRQAVLLLAAAGSEKSLSQSLLLLASLLGPDVRLPREPVDVEALLHALESGQLDARLAQLVKKERRRLQARLDRVPAAAKLSVDSLAEALLLAFPDRLAQRRGGRGRFRLIEGGGARLAENSALADTDWMVIVDIAGGREGQIRRALPLREDEVLQLCADRIKETTTQFFDVPQGRVAAVREQKLGQLLLRSQACALVDSDAAEGMLAEALSGALWERLPWLPHLRQLCARATWLKRRDDIRADLSEAGLRAEIQAWLRPFLAGVTDIQALDAKKLAAALEYRLGPERALLDRLAPGTVQINGKDFKLNYSAENAPVLAAEVQWFYGLGTGPAVADGAHPVCLHLLNPARRPLAVTRDLASFWANAWSEVRGQMRSRYPKHSWPEKPESADLPERFMRLRSAAT